MYSLVYVSSAAEPFSKSELVELLAQCHENNMKAGLTGLLLYKDGNFMQVLEGEKDTVKSVFSRIGRDPRHRGLITLYDEDISERQYPDWSMAFRDLDSPEVRALPGFSEFMNLPLNAPSLQANVSLCKSLLLTFKRSM